MRPIKSLSLPRRRIAALSLMFAGTLAAGSAAACDVWRDEFGFYRGNCNLSVDFKDKYRVNMEFIATLEPRYHFKLPNFHPRKFKYFVTGSDVEISIDVENIGELAAPAADVAVVVNIVDPLTGMQYSSSPYVARTTTIQPASTQRLLVTHVQVPNLSQDWDIVSVATVDPATAAQPVRGNVVESDETDNGLMHACRVFGPNPDTSLEACN